MSPRFTFHLETAQFAIDFYGFFHLVYKLFFPLSQYLFVFPMQIENGTSAVKR